MGTTGTNWAGNYSYNATKLHEPTTIDELRRVVVASRRIRALGSRHTFNPLPDSEELISVANLPSSIEIDREAGSVSVGAGVKYGHLAIALEDAGFALHNMASLPHISVAGAVATATHGSGDRSGNLATAVVGMELVTSDGDIMSITKDDPEFDGMVVHIGALGVVTRLTLRVEPSYQVRQQVFEHLPWDVALGQFDEVMSSDDSVSMFTDFGDSINEVWRKHRVADDEEDMSIPEEFRGARASAVNLHPVSALSAEACTDQLGAPGPWLHRLPHFRMEATPASGDEIQSEFMVAREDAVQALTALREIGSELQPHIWISEIRSVAKDDLWLSSAYQRDTVCFHFSFRRDQGAVDRLVPRIEGQLAPFDPRPHWGKVFTIPGAALQASYPRMEDFRALAERLDPRGAFRNRMIDEIVFG